MTETGTAGAGTGDGAMAGGVGEQSGLVRLARCAAVGVAVVVAACAAGPGDGVEDEETRRADFRLPTLAGEVVGPPDFAGKVVVADFWATWCAPCRLQAEVLEGLHAEYPADAVQFLAINLGEERETVARFVADDPFPYPVLLDPAEEVGGALGVVALPTVLVVDGSGEITYLEAGIVPEERLRRLIEEARG